MLTLDLAMITHRPEGIVRLAGNMPAPMPGVRYVVSWQEHGGAPVPDEIACRPDVEVHRLDERGLANNRNNAIAHCSADVVLFADDDIAYTREGLLAVVDTFGRNPDVDVATFRSVHGDASRFPACETALERRLPKGYYVASVEIAFRRATAGMLRCCPELGLGAPRLHAGEDEMFLMSAIRRGLRCRFFPSTICTHRGESTGTGTSLSDGTLEAFGCVIALTHPLTAALRVPLKAWRVSRAGAASLPRALCRVALGALQAPGVLRRNRATLW
ncbi:MAG: glycosyltransferase [Muribaculaceae bacterium]|nr:glycosyltransferase [Muribaculaceae bacterium]